MIEYFDGTAASDKIADWCCQVEKMEAQAYGDGNNRKSSLLQALCHRNGEGFIFAVEDGNVIGTADFWEVENVLYAGITFDEIPEENLPLEFIIERSASPATQTGLWYLASFIIVPEYRSKSPGASPIYRKLCQLMWKRILAGSKRFPIKFLGVVSSESGRRMMSGWEMREITTRTKKDRCEAVYPNAEHVEAIIEKYQS